MRLYPLAVLVLILIASCQSAAPTQQPQANYRTGTQGLQVQFLPNLPPARLYDDQEFDITVRVANVGATDVGFANDRIYLSGFDHRLLPGIPFTGQPIPPTEGKNAFNLQGTFDYATFQATVLPLKDRDLPSYRFTLMGTACYGYETIGSGEACIDTDPFSTTVKQKVCPVGSITFVGSQGAPVAISSVQVEPSPKKTRFTITIANVGGGEVFREGATYLNKCSPYDPQGLRFDEIDYVALEEVRISDLIEITQTCKPRDQDGRHIKLINGQATIHCEVDHAALGLQGSFVTPLVVRLRYGYRNVMQTPVEILSSP